MQNNKETFLKVIGENPRGFTADKNGNLQNFKRGYAVSVTNNASTDKAALIDKAFNNFKSLNRIYKNLFFGGWHDVQSGLFYLDMSLIITNRKTALMFARMHNQKAIFNFKTFEEIRV